MHTWQELTIALLLIGCALLQTAAWLGGRDENVLAPDAAQALQQSLRSCGKSPATWQASTTNEPGVVWFSMRCEVRP